MHPIRYWNSFNTPGREQMRRLLAMASVSSLWMSMQTLRKMMGTVPILQFHHSQVNEGPSVALKLARDLLYEGTL